VTAQQRQEKNYKLVGHMTKQVIHTAECSIQI